MIRLPSSPDRLLRFWTALLANPELPRHEGEPECGYYQTRRVKGGPWVPVAIFCRQITDPETGELSEPETVLVRFGGRTLDARKPEERDEIERLWLYCEAIPKEAYLRLLASIRSTPVMSHEDRRVDLSQTPIPPRQRGLFDA